MSVIETLMMSCLFAGAGVIFAYFVRRMGEASVEGRPEYRKAKQALPRRAQLEVRFEMRKGELVQTISKLTGGVGDMRRRRYTLEKQLIDARREADQPVRVVGNEGKTSRRYKAWMVNRIVQAAQTEGKTHATLDMDWAMPQIVEVWAESLADARKEIHRVYPPPLGFNIVNLKLELGSSVEGEEKMDGGDGN